MFKAWLLEKSGLLPHAFGARVASVDEAGLPPGDVMVRIARSTVDHKGLPVEKLEAIPSDIRLAQAIETAGDLKNGRVRGRVVFTI